VVIRLAVRPGKKRGKVGRIRVQFQDLRDEPVGLDQGDVVQQRADAVERSGRIPIDHLWADAVEFTQRVAARVLEGIQPATYLWIVGDRLESQALLHRSKLPFASTCLPGLETVEKVQAALDAILDAQETFEIDRRVMDKLGNVRFRPTRPITEVGEQLSSFQSELTTRYEPTRVATAITEAQAEVAELRASNRRREMFHGKSVVDEFFRLHLHAAGLSKSVFKFEAARYARRRQAVRQFFDDFFAHLDALPSEETSVQSRPISTDIA